MSIFEAIILGIIQGATEFLPVSSSGHSILIPAVFDLTPPSLDAVAIAHLGTLLAVLIYFFNDIWNIAVGVLVGLRDRDPMGTTESRLGWFIVVGSIPAAAVGLTLEDYFEEIFASPAIAAGFLLVTAALLVVGERMLSGEKDLSKMGWFDAIFIGVFQALALFPGISRSGSTIVGSLIRGLDRETAARFSFLLGIPAILGAGLLSVVDLIGAPGLASQIVPFVVLFVVSAVSGYACIHLLLQWVKQRSLIPFAVYCVAFSLVYLIFWVVLA